jgi:hypothetical protein
MAKVFTDPLRIKIVLELGMRELSPKQFHQEFGGGSLSRVARAFDVLAEYDWLVLTETKTGGERRGGVEHFYRATQPALMDEKTWPQVPAPLKSVFTSMVFSTFAERVNAAIEAGTIDERPERHASWIPLLFDQQGWDSAIAKVDALFHWFFDEQEEANLRMVESGEAPIPMTVALAVFESPKDTEKQP